MTDAPAPPRVKICGLTRPADARAAADAGAAYLGVVVVPDTPRAVSPSNAREIRADLAIPLVLVSADRAPEALARDAERAGADVLQLHGRESPAHVRSLRELGAWTIWKSVRVREPEDVDEALRRYGSTVDGLHLDGWHPRHLGGTGRRFPWAAVREILDRVPDGLQLIAAGGLTPGNVAEAVETLRPDVVDVSSGVEAVPGKKDDSRVRAFIRAAQVRGETESTDSHPSEETAQR